MSDLLDDLIEQLKEGDDDARLAAIRAMGELADPRATELLMTVVLFDERGYVRYDATLALEHVDRVRSAEFLEDILRDAESHTLKIRCRAIKALGRLGDADLIPLLEGIAANDEEIEAATAQEALQHILKRTQNP
jgi:HEAT repeat protein